MRKITWVLGTILLVLAVGAAGCATKAPPAVKQAPAKGTVVEGTLGDVSVEKKTVTIETPQGLKPFQIGPGTALTVEGKPCTLDQLAALEASGDTFDCTVV